MRKKLAGAALLLSITVAAFGAALIVGREARTVDVLTLVASGFAAGASLVSYLHRAREKGSGHALEKPPEA